MADKLRSIVDAYLAGGMPPNIALMRLCIEAGSPEEVRAAVHSAETQLAAAGGDAGSLSSSGRGGRTELPASKDGRMRVAALSKLLDQHPSAWATVREVMAEAEHDRAPASEQDAVAHWAGVFDRLAQAHPEAGVALYALGSPELLGTATAEIVEALREWRLIHPEAEVLEIGCGIGRFVRALSPEVAEVTGIDLSPAMIEEARRRCAGFANVRLDTASGRDLSAFSDATFDLVLAADVFPYLVQAGGELAARHVAEAARVLRPGGTLAILNYSYRGDPARDREEIEAARRSAGFASLAEPRPCFRFWDGAVFLLAKPAA